MTRWYSGSFSSQQQYSLDIQSVFRSVQHSSAATRRLVWNSLLAGFAALDFGAAMARRHGAAFLERHSSLSDSASPSYDINLRHGVVSRVLVPTVTWLCQTASIWSMLFALLWFMDALIGARQFRDAAQRRKDQRRLQQLRRQRHALQLQRLQRNSPRPRNKDSNRAVTIDASTRTLDVTSLVAVRTGEPTLDTLLDDAKELWTQSEHSVRYYRTMALQIMLLPLGFFVALYQPVLWMWQTFVHHDGEQHGLVADAVHSIQSYASTTLPGHLYATFHEHVHEVNNSPCNTATHEHDWHGHWTANLDVGLGFAVVQRTLVWLAHRTGTVVRLSAVSHGCDLAQTLLVRALHHPIRFNRRIRTFLRLVRWIQYLGPLLGTTNKLIGNVLNLVSKYKQRRAQLQAQKNLFVPTTAPLQSNLDAGPCGMPCHSIETSTPNSQPTVQTEAAANQIQSFVRQRLQASHVHHQEHLLEELVVETWKLPNDQATLAALTIQRACRAALHRVRNRFHERVQLLHSLQEKERLSHRRSNRPLPWHTRHAKAAGVTVEATLTVEERRRMYVLQEELEAEAHSWINGKLLLRPNTTFAVWWKILFVVAVIFEISALAFQPVWARRHKDPVTGKPLDLEAILDKKLIPTPVFKLDVCKRHQTVKSPLHFDISCPVQSTRQVLQALGSRVQSVFDRSETPKTPRPWYCQGSYSRLQAVYITLANLAVHHFFVILSIICFVDVYIEFFTGQYDRVTGKLVPPPFFARYIFPGLLLQFLVNPEMDTVSEMATHTVAGLLYHGPERIVRWTLALFYPALMCLAHLVRWVWLGTARHQNCRLWYRIPYYPGTATNEK